MQIRFSLGFSFPPDDDDGGKQRENLIILRHIYMYACIYNRVELCYTRNYGTDCVKELGLYCERK